LLAGVASMPFAAAHFGHATAYFVPANLMAVPITALLIMPSGLLAVFLMQVHLEWLAMPFLRCGLHWIVVIAHTVAAWPGSIMAVPPVSGWALACIGFSMAWIGIWRGGLRWLCAPLLVGGLLAPWFATPPDLLISADFKLIGLMRTRDLLIEQQPHASAFTLDAWRQYWGRRSVTTLPPVGQGELFRCDAAGCRLGLPDWQALLLRRDGTPDCGAIAVVISENSRVSCPGTLQIGPHSAHFNGAIAIWLDRRRRRVDVLETGNGDRPWNRSLPLSNPLPDLPMAQSE
jgi:competence protein ComEC